MGQSSVPKVIPLPSVALAQYILRNNARVDFESRVSQDSSHATVVEEIPRPGRGALEEAAVDHSSAQRNVVDIRMNGIEPFAQRLVDFPFGVGPASFEPTGGDGEDDIQMIRILGEPQESTGLEAPLEQCLDVLSRVHCAP